MKKNLLTLSLLFFAVVNSFAQKADPKNVLKIGFPELFAASLNLAYERAINDKVSFQVTGGYRHIQDSYGITWTDNDNTRSEDRKIYSGYTVVPELKYYLTNTTWAAPKGFYISAFGRYGKYDVEFNDNTTPNNDYNATYSYTEAGGGVLGGFQFIFAKVFVMDFYIGPQMKLRTLQPVTYENKRIITDPKKAASYIGVEEDGQRPGVRIGFKIGAAF
ncbi:MAG: DUF3575 domain-containing protein [Sporocytophaga sp.]|uniref:DUF3575 domain-containing protein n=1 Tax=Sporocytophaga sp. TaxID=2231183 RepID=UPI001B1A1282|nr:DUF3575 domain-containing protein [Sporocytophaga sp.]MBO9702278.1 DUF3575 domain-containing protein [Sporocytophaga sp.]